MPGKEGIFLHLPKLDDRLSKAAELFPSCRLGADIGADHGRLSLHLLASGRCERMVVSDISGPALDKARTLLSRHGLDRKAVCTQADGLEALAEPVQAVSILGMGGDTIAAILARAPERLAGASLILSPHTELAHLRAALPGIGYRIGRECIARAGGRFYVLLLAVPGDSAYTEKELLLGPGLLRERPPLFQEYLLWRQRVAQKAVGIPKSASDAGPRLQEWERLIAYIGEELA